MDTITITMQHNSVWRDALDLRPWYGDLLSLAGCEVRVLVPIEAGDVLLTTALDVDDLPQGIEIVEPDKMTVLFTLDAAGREAIPAGRYATDLMVVTPEGDPHVRLAVVLDVSTGVTTIPEEI
jgi:hypothetical protein